MAVAPANFICQIEKDPRTSGPMLYYRDDGHLYCVEHDDAIDCSCVEDALMKGWDSQAIWKHSPPDAELRDTLNLQIPISPRNGYWTLTTLHKHETLHLYQVVWVDSPSGPDIVCYLNPGEGRNVVRQVLLDRMVYSITPGTECSSFTHGVAAQLEWEKHTNTVGGMMALETWSIYTTGYCIYCNKERASLDDSDLVPDKEGSVW